MSNAVFIDMKNDIILIQPSFIWSEAEAFLKGHMLSNARDLMPCVRVGRDARAGYQTNVRQLAAKLYWREKPMVDY